MQNQDGCILKDSVFIATIGNPNTGTSTVFACDSTDWNGEIITVSGSYDQTFTNVSGCDSVHTLVAVDSFPIIDSIWASKNPIYKGESTTLNIQTNENVLWEWGDSAKQIVVAPITDSLFVVEIYNEFGCSIYDSIFIIILDVFCDEGKIKIPTAFTPNNDDKNNTYRITDTDGLITSFKLEIFNRFGQKVYSSNNKNAKWDGTYQNELLAPQVFDFYLELECFGGKRLFKKGNITLIR